jgi:hypothetical protein
MTPSYKSANPDIEKKELTALIKGSWEDLNSISAWNMKHTGLLDDWKIANDAFKKTQESTDVPVVNTPAPVIKAAVSKTHVAASDKPPPRPPTAYA